MNVLELLKQPKIQYCADVKLVNNYYLDCTECYYNKFYENESEVCPIYFKRHYRYTRKS